MSWLRCAACGAGLVLAGCGNFPVIESDQCGNAVIEAGEDCDTFAEKGASCRPPGMDGACRYDCRPDASGRRFACPTGMGCAADGVCRRPTGDFDVPSLLASERSPWLSSADFDGDGRHEIISAERPDQFLRARFRLHYVDNRGALQETRTFPHFTTRPDVGDLNGDGLADLVFSNQRVGMVPGRADRAWAPASFSSFLAPGSGVRVVGVREQPLLGAAALAALMTLDGVPGVYVANSATETLERRATLPAGVEELAGLPVAANLVEGSGSPCAELVLAFRGTAGFRVLDLCEVQVVDGTPQAVWRASPVEHLVALPPGLRVDAGPLAADVDGDGYLDVVIGAAGRPYVARGDGQGLASTAELLEVALEDPEGEPLAMPLAAGDVTGDGVADFVLPRGVLASRARLDGSGSSYFPSFINREQPWTVAHIADLNGNGLPDIVAASEGSPGLAFLNGTGGPFQIAARLPTPGAIRLLATGDIDGDLLKDVAFLQGGALAGAAGSLAIAFGARDGLPQEPQLIAELESADQLGAFAEAGKDTLFVTSRRRIDRRQHMSLTLFEGGPDRLPFAPYSLVDFAVTGQVFDMPALSLLLGAFTAPGAHDALVVGALDATGPWTQWLIPDLASGERPPRPLAGDSPAGVAPASSNGGKLTLSVAGAVADLNRDGVDEAIWAMGGGARCTLLFYEVDARAAAVVPRRRLDWEGPCSAPVLSVSDLDRDGALDLLLLSGDHEQLSRELHVLWNDGAGGFSLSEKSPIAAASGGDVRSFAVFDQDGPRIAFVTSSALHVAKAGSSARHFGEVKRLAGLDDPTSVVVADSNGDGFLDVVVADGGGIWWFGAQLR